MKRLGELLLLACAVALLMGADSGDNSRYQKVGGKIMCPCSCSQMLLKCNHVGCPDSDLMIRQLRASLQQYDRDDDVLNFFRKTWGVTAIVEPGTRGFELLAWVLPVAGLVLGLGAVVVVLRRGQLPAPEAKPATVNLPQRLEPWREQARRETEI